MTFIDTQDIVENYITHAEWLLENLEYGIYKCSRCGNMIPAVTYEELNKHHKYCGQCGAKMTVHRWEDGDEKS